MRLLAMLSLVSFAAAADEPKWEKKEFECQRPEKGCHIPPCCQYGLAVYTREKPGMDVREVKAVGQVDAPPEKVFEVVTDYEHQIGNMPYIEKAQVFARTEKDVIFWAQADFPMVSRRDWVVKSKLEKNLPGGVWRAGWEPVEVKEAPPAADNVVRLKVNTGSWTLEPLDGGKRTLGTYQLLTDPGGSIPTFIANKANTTALPLLFERVRARAEAK
jgi:hypothetical protein